MRLALHCAALLLMMVSGCARYEYDVSRPPESAQHVGAQADVVIVRDPVVYRMRTAENHLVIRIQNPTDDRVQLRGAQSFVVDPQGESRPLRSQTIAPHAFIKLILPPMPPQPVPTGPTIGFGIGAGFGLVYPYDYYDPLWDR